MRRINHSGRMARHLREMAIEFASHLHDEPIDSRDSAGKERWMKLARAAYEYARSEGKLSWVSK